MVSILDVIGDLECLRSKTLDHVILDFNHSQLVAWPSSNMLKSAVFPVITTVSSGGGMDNCKGGGALNLHFA